MNVARSRTVSLLSAGTRICAAGAILCLATAGDAGAQEAARDASDWKERQTLTGDWAGARTRLEEKGITVRSRLSQFVQGINAGEGAPDYAYGGKLDFMVRSDFEKLGFWRGLSLTAKAEYNFGDSMNARGGTMVPVNTALAFPGIEGADALDISSFYFTQTFGTNASLVFGKINMFDAAASKRFAGGSEIIPSGIRHSWPRRAVSCRLTCLVRFFRPKPSGRIMGFGSTTRSIASTEAAWKHPSPKVSLLAVQSSSQ